MYVGRGVDYPTIFEYFKMNVRASGTATAAHQANHLALANDVTGLDDQLFVMTVSRRVAAAVIELHHLPVATSRACKHYDSRRNRNNICAVFTGKIDTVVPGALSGDWIIAVSISGGHPSFGDRTASKEHIPLHFSVDQQRFQHT